VDEYVRQLFYILKTLGLQENTIVIHKIKHNIPVTNIEIEQLENMLFSSEIVGGKEKFEKAFGEQERLGLFVRKLVGLDRNTAKEAFTDFIQKHTLNTTQIRFVDYIINYLTQNGVMDIDAFYDPPFTDLSDSGIDGVFPGDDANIVIDIVRGFEESAIG
jgi:type I restriction enzyme R subunit